MILLNYGAQWLQEIWTFEYHPPTFKNRHRLASAASNSNLIFHDSNKKYVFSKHQSKAEFRNLDDSAVISSDFPGLRTFAALMTSKASFHQKNTDPDGEIILTTQMIKTSPFLWNGS